MAEPQSHWQSEGFKKRLRRRNAQERRFRRLGIAAVLLAGAALAMLLVSVLSNGWRAAFRTEIALDVDFDPETLGIESPSMDGPTEIPASADFGAVLRNSLLQTIPGVEGRAAVRELVALLSRGASADLAARLRAEPALLGRRERLWVPASDEVDLLVNARRSDPASTPSTRLSEQQIGWTDALAAQARVARRFNSHFFTGGDSREPELAGIGGALVGTLLTLLMAKAMNRSVANVLFGAFGQVQAGAGQARADDGRTVRATTADDVAVQLSFARKVIIVPGYGMAVAQAQHDVRQLADLLEEKGVDVKYAIHPVAGRMPGHMNVLLAEANVPYTQLFEMDEINPEFPQTDVALVIGANDVTNPAARSDQSSPIYGMPILDVDKAASIVVMKRSMNPGFAGIDNELYLDPKTTMLFGDAKESVLKLIGAVKAM